MLYSRPLLKRSGFDNPFLISFGEKVTNHMIRECINPYCKRMIFGHRFSGYCSEKCMDDYLDRRIAMREETKNPVVLDNCNIMPCDIYIGGGFPESNEDRLSARNLILTLRKHDPHLWRGLSENVARSALNGKMDNFFRRGIIVRGDDGYYRATYRLLELLECHIQTGHP